MDAEIVSVLRNHPRSDKRAIARELRGRGIVADPSSVNSRLYRLLKAGEVIKEGDSPPRWSAASAGAAAPKSRSAKKAKTRAQSKPTAVRTGLPLRAWQEEALQAWERAERVGVVQAVTGTGKTQVGIEAAYGHLSEGGRALVIVPTKALLHQWARALVSTFGESRVGRRGDGFSDTLLTRDIVVSTIHSATGARPPSTGGLVIADECHRYGARSWFESLDDCFTARLGLTATLERNDEGDALLEDYFRGGPVFDIGYRRAIDEGTVAPFRLAFVGVRLSPREEREYEECDRKCRKARRDLVKLHKLADQPFATFMQQVAVAAKGKWVRSPEATLPARVYTSNFAKRRAIVADSAAKATMIRTLAPLLETANGTLIFTQTRHAAEEAARVLAGQGHRAAAIYGELAGEERERLLEAFRSKETTVLSAPRVLDEGIDVPEADLGIIVSASHSKRQMIQRMGRTLRLKQDGRDARLIVLYAEGTGEDPETGAHESFISMAWEVAQESRVFRAAGGVADLRAFMEVRMVGARPTVTAAAPSSFVPRRSAHSAGSRSGSRIDGSARRPNTCALCDLPLGRDGQCRVCWADPWN